jgi:uncharacterized protein (TIGR03067 family)
MQTSLLITLFARGAPAAKEKPKGGIDIVSEWVAVSQEYDGKPAMPIADSLTFMADGKWERVFQGKPMKNCEKYVLDVTEKPATLDLLFTPDTNAAGLFGIVRVDGDTLTICYSYNSKVRAQKFAAETGSGYTLLIMKRKKKE